MTRTTLTRFVLGIALLTAPAALVGCGEGAKPDASTAPASTGPTTPAPAK